MKNINAYVIQYVRSVDKKVLYTVTLFTAVLVWYNYDAGLEETALQSELPEKTFIRFGTFFIAFTVPYLIHTFFQKRSYFNSDWFIVALIAAPLIFTLKMVLPIKFMITDQAGLNAYWNHVLYWPLRLLIIVTLVFVLRKIAILDPPGIRIQNGRSNLHVYLILLICMIPLVAAASTQPDFLAMYPKLKIVQHTVSSQSTPWLFALLFELSYGSDFFTIEFFFRGFLVVCFIKWAGKDAILPMACFYCTIHFGKPLAECISSYFGGIILGAIVYNTRNIYGGLIVHLGIAWMMEIGGFIGNYLSK